MSLPLADLEAARTKLLQQFLSLGDFRPGTVSAVPRRCGKPKCRCARSTLNRLGGSSRGDEKCALDDASGVERRF